MASCHAVCATAGKSASWLVAQPHAFDLAGPTRRHGRFGMAVPGRTCEGRWRISRGSMPPVIRRTGWVDLYRDGIVDASAGWGA